MRYCPIIVDMKNIGLIVAVEIDAVKTLFGEAIQSYREHGFGVSIHERHDLRLTVIHCGIGSIAASAATLLAIEKYKAEIIVNFGLVGALTAEASKTPIALVEKIIDSEMDVYELDRIPVGQHEGFSSPYLSMDKKLLALALKANPSLPKATCVSGNQFLVGEEKENARRKFHGDICDMEIAGIAYTAANDDIPVLCLKIVSDSVFGGAASSELFSGLASSLAQGFQTKTTTASSAARSTAIRASSLAERPDFFCSCGAAGAASLFLFRSFRF